MLITPVSANVYAKEEIPSAAVDISGHMEVTGKDPGYPEAPNGFQNYEDYKQNTGWVHDTEFYYDQYSKTWYSENP